MKTLGLKSSVSDVDFLEYFHGMLNILEPISILVERLQSRESSIIEASVLINECLDKLKELIIFDAPDSKHMRTLWTNSKHADTGNPVDSYDDFHIMTSGNYAGFILEQTNVFLPFKRNESSPYAFIWQEFKELVEDTIESINKRFNGINYREGLQVFQNERYARFFIDLQTPDKEGMKAFIESIIGETLPDFQWEFGGNRVVRNIFNRFHEFHYVRAP